MAITRELDQIQIIVGPNAGGNSIRLHAVIRDSDEESASGVDAVISMGVPFTQLLEDFVLVALARANLERAGNRQLTRPLT